MNAAALARVVATQEREIARLHSDLAACSRETNAAVLGLKRTIERARVALDKGHYSRAREILNGEDIRRG